MLVQACRFAFSKKTQANINSRKTKTSAMYQEPSGKQNPELKTATEERNLDLRPNLQIWDQRPDFNMIK